MWMDRGKCGSPSPILSRPPSPSPHVPLPPPFIPSFPPTTSFSVQTVKRKCVNLHGGQRLTLSPRPVQLSAFLRAEQKWMNEWMNRCLWLLETFARVTHSSTEIFKTPPSLESFQSFIFTVTAVVGSFICSQCKSCECGTVIQSKQR